MKRKLNRLKPVARITGSAEKQAARLIDRGRAEILRFQSQLRELKDYRKDYAHRCGDSAGVVINAGRMQDCRALLVNLDRGIADIERHIAVLQAGLEEKKLDWIRQRTRAQGLDKIVSKVRKLVRRDEDRRGQREIDDRVLRKR